MFSYKKLALLTLLLGAGLLIGGCTAATPVATATPARATATAAPRTAAPAAVTVTAAAATAAAPTRTVPAATAAATPASAATATLAPAATATRAPAAATTGAPAATVTRAPAVTAPAAAPTVSAAGIEPATTAAAPEARAPVCTPGTLTVAQTEGPYYKANPPERSSLLEAGTTGTKLILTGYVLDQNCKPLPGARVDFWQADGSGNYDNSGYRFRGFVRTDAQGRYSMETIPPGLYTGRARHIHVKVTPAGGATLTTQLYLPGDASNANDGIFDPKMVLELRQTASGQVGYFDFVVRAG